ncbi:MAG: hypothetical protein BAA02_03345 [Paenibacillaceae bacterium ZCTH02-B3]|nr:MAG: hypothetical protein BAA02_03345 [Paenibacillaceae bacterium ZCTH02-B3]
MRTTLWGKRPARPAPAAESGETAAERRRLLDEIRRAHLEWTLAQWRFHDAIGYDQVDYAIYSLEAAEKKYGMLLRKAKILWNRDGWSHDGPGTGAADGFPEKSAAGKGGEQP